MEKIFAIEGWVRPDKRGRVVIDDCPSDTTHRDHAKPDPEAGQASCRYVLEDLFKPIMNKRGCLVVTIQFVEDEAAGSIYDAIKQYAEGDRAAA